MFHGHVFTGVWVSKTCLNELICKMLHVCVRVCACGCVCVCV